MPPGGNIPPDRLAAQANFDAAVKAVKSAMDALEKAMNTLKDLDE